MCPHAGLGVPSSKMVSTGTPFTHSSLIASSWTLTKLAVPLLYVPVHAVKQAPDCHQAGQSTSCLCTCWSHSPSSHRRLGAHLHHWFVPVSSWGLVFMYLLSLP